MNGKIKVGYDERKWKGATISFISDDGNRNWPAVSIDANCNFGDSAMVSGYRINAAGFGKSDSEFVRVYAKMLKKACSTADRLAVLYGGRKMRQEERLKWEAKQKKVV